MKRIIISSVILIYFNLSGLAQFDIQTGTEIKPPKLGADFDELFKSVQQPVGTMLFTLPPLEGPVDPDNYIVGPGDILSVNIWSSPALSFPVQITMEGTAIIPTVGEVKVAGFTLSRAKELIIKKAKEKYIASDITVTLISPRTFLVTVTGWVLNQGRYPASVGDRASTVILLANEPQDTSQIRKRFAIIDSMSFRKIQIRRKGKIINVDLMKYMATGDSRYNPLLLDGDWIFVPRRDFNSFISIYGAVNKQGVYEFVEGDSLKDLIAIAGGFLESADIENIEISRLDENGALKEKIQVNFKDILDGKAPDIKLEKNDRILVPEKRTLKQDYKVYVDGEVNYPGFYPISRNGTKLSEILEKAGINRYAELGEAIILRGRANNYKDIHELYPALLLKGFGLADEDSIYFNRELRLLSSFQFVAVNLEDVINGKSDCELQDNDLIYIPPKTNSVYVFGQVNNPGFVEYKDGEDYRYYISKAGGFSQLARKGDVKVIKRKTYNWYDAESVTIEPGDFILVPKKIPRSASYYFRVIRDASLAIGGIISSLILILNILNQFKK